MLSCCFGLIVKGREMGGGRKTLVVEGRDHVRARMVSGQMSIGSDTAEVLCPVPHMVRHERSTERLGTVVVRLQGGLRKVEEHRMHLVVAVHSYMS